VGLAGLQLERGVETATERTPKKRTKTTGFGLGRKAQHKGRKTINRGENVCQIRKVEGGGGFWLENREQASFGPKEKGLSGNEKKPGVKRGTTV